MATTFVFFPGLVAAMASVRFTKGSEVLSSANSEETLTVPLSVTDSPVTRIFQSLMGASLEALRVRLTSFLPSGISTSVGAPIPGGFQGSFTFIFLLKSFSRLAVILSVMVPFLTSGTGGAKSSRWKGASSIMATESLSVLVMW